MPKLSNLVSQKSLKKSQISLRPHTIDGRTVQPKRAVPREESASPGANVTVNKIFIGGIRDKPIDKRDLEMYFGAFGTIKVCLFLSLSLSLFVFVCLYLSVYPGADIFVIIKNHGIIT